MARKTKTVAVPANVADKAEDQRAIQIPPQLRRIYPAYGTPSWLDAARWRQFVKNQPIAIVARDTLISNMLSMEWDIIAKNPEDGGLKKVKDAIDYHKELFTYLEGEFDIYLELLLQDMLDLPFGAAVEVGRWDDEPTMPVIWAEHIDGGTLFPTHSHDFPVAQQVPDFPNVQVVFPDHAIERIYMTPRPEFKLAGWGMAPPQKIYMAIEMLFRGDHYYWKLLMDTPEAGMIDLGKMSQSTAEEWLEGFRDTMMGVDPWKVPILYETDGQAKWIPFGRPPHDMLYDKQYIKYAQIVCSGYGLRVSDIGLSEVQGERSLAGVIRGERQTKRTGRALVKSKTENHFNALLPEELLFVWKDTDEEDTVARGKALISVTQGIGQAIKDGLMDGEEGRAELAASAVLVTEIDPKKKIEKPEPQFPPGMSPFGGGNEPFGGNGADQGKVPAGQGGIGTTEPPSAQVMRQRPEAEDEEGEPEYIEPQLKPTREQLLERMEAIIAPGLQTIIERAEGVRLRRLIKAATRHMFADIAMKIRSMTDEQVRLIWLPEIQKATFDLPSEVESPFVRRDIEEAKEALEAHLEDDPWWSMAGVLERQRVLDLFVSAYELGMENQALEIIRSLYEEGMTSTPYLPVDIAFDLVDEAVMNILERSAADMVANVNNGTKFFIKRIVVAGVREGMSSPRIAQAIRDGARAEQLLERDDFIGDIAQIIREGLIEMSEARANSIVNTEIRRAESLGTLEQMKRSGLTVKRWKHMGERGISKAGNPHPCPVCLGNEELGNVDIDHVYKTVFKKGGVDGEGGHLTPPAHPQVCHCILQHDVDDLMRAAGSGGYAPWTGD